MQVHHRSETRRKAFSLIELVIVITIILVLMGLLFPAIGRAIGSTRNAEVVNEISQLEKAIAAFELEFGVAPPSNFILYENGSSATPNWTSDSTADPYDLNNDGNMDNDDRVLRQRQTLAFLRQAFPNFNPGTAPAIDFNGDGDTDDTLLLSGSECLLFFLGGMTATEDGTGPIRNINNGSSRTATPTRWIVDGFSTNPQNPFARGGSRIGPFYEFDTDRIRDQNAGEATELHSMPEYFDMLPGQTSPYVFASSNGGRGYDARDLIPSTVSAGLSRINLVYFQDQALLVPHNKNSFQIISPGQDLIYGTGGYYNSDEGLESTRLVDESDNITNFSGGVLAN